MPIPEYKHVDGERVKLTDAEKREIQKRREQNRPSLSEAQEERIEEIKERAEEILTKTDWYIIREQDSGESVPQSVIDHRAEVRSMSDKFESDVTDLDTVSEVIDYSFQYPEPPEA